MTSNAVLADSQIRSHSTWQDEDMNISAIFTFTIADAEQLILASKSFTDNSREKNSNHLLSVLSDNIDIISLQNNCLLDDKKQLLSAANHIRVKLSYQCKQPLNSISVKFSALFNIFAQHIHLAKYQDVNNIAIQQVLTTRHSQFTLPIQFSSAVKDQPQSVEKSTISSVFASYLILGYEHILAGADHLSFVLALLLLVFGLKNIVLLITGFTLGHMLTLSLTALELFSPNSLWVEALIGFSIALIACENIIIRGGRAKPIIVAGVSMLVALILFQRDFSSQSLPLVLSLLGLIVFWGCYLLLSEQSQHRLPWQMTITLLFGLIHGFGFAGALNEIGLPENDIMPALVAFNLGVELGQITVVIIFTGLVTFVNKYLLMNRPLYAHLASSMLCCLGVFWFVSRTLNII